MQRKSLGLIETWGHVPAVEAADAGCKAANVALAGYEEVRAGLVTIIFTGDVAAVKTAVTAGATAARRVGKVVSCHVIPRPDRQLQSFSPPPVPPEPPATPPSAPTPAPPEAPPPAPEQSAAPPPETSSNSKEKATESPGTAAPAAKKAAAAKSTGAAEGKKPGTTRRKKKT